MTTATHGQVTLFFFFFLFEEMWQGVCRASITTLRELCAPPPITTPSSSFYGYIVYTGIQSNSTHDSSDPATCAIAFLLCVCASVCVCVFVCAYLGGGYVTYYLLYMLLTPFPFIPYLSGSLYEAPTCMLRCNCPELIATFRLWITFSLSQLTLALLQTNSPDMNMVW